MSKPIILIDGSSWIFRAFFALPPLANSRGEPTGAVHGMVNMVQKLLREHQPERICVVFDPKGKTFRDEIYPAYKANRTETPEDLSAQFPVVAEILKAMGLSVIAVEGMEADDVIGTLATQAGPEATVLIVTGDKDMAQLVGEHVQLLDTMKNRRLDRAAVIEKFGVPPERIIDYLALMGDATDNIPGVPLVGPKTAAKWLNEYGSLDAVVENAAKIPGKAGENLRAHLEQLPMAKRLTTIRCDVPLPFRLEELAQKPPEREALLALLKRWELRRFAEDVEKSIGPSTASAEPSAAAPGGIAEPRPVDERPVSAKTRAELVLDESAFAAMLEALHTAELVCFDTETDSIDSNQARLVGLAFAIEAGAGWYLPLAHDYLGAPAQLPMADVLARVRPILEDARKPKLAQHGKYDINVLVRHGVQVRGLAHDTMLESYVLDATANRHDMDTLAERHLNHQTIHFADVAGKGKNQLTFNQVAVDRAAEYSAEDADVTLRLHQVLYPKLCAVEPLKRVYETIEMPLVPVLCAMEQRGVRIDSTLLGQISRELAGRMGELQAEAWREAGGEFNLGSPKQLQTILYEKLQLPVLAKTPKGDPSTAEDVLEDLAAQARLPRVILDWRGMQKLRSTYADQLPNAINPFTKRVHTSYHQAVAATGRLSSQDPNLQNIPVRTVEGRRIRQAFIAEPGNTLLSIDYSQIELRLMAHLSGDERLREAFRQGLDVHRATAAEIFGLTLEQVGDDQRRAAKAINFGLIYGMSAFGLAQRLSIPRNEASEYMERFFARYPRVREFMDNTKSSARKLGYVETLFGRRLYLPNINSKNAPLRQYAERTAINAPLQGTAADLIKLAMIDVQRYLVEKAPDISMIMQVHDELVFEGPSESLTRQAPELAGHMCRITPLAVPLVADFGLGANWDAAHHASGHASS